MLSNNALLIILGLIDILTIIGLIIYGIYINRKKDELESELTLDDVASDLKNVSKSLVGLHPRITSVLTYAANRVAQGQRITPVNVKKILRNLK